MSVKSNCSPLLLSVLLAGVPAAAVGLMATTPMSAAQDRSQRPVTFTKDIAPILQRSCQTCHRPGQIAPMSLVTYADVRPWTRSVRQRVSLREMPPWYIEKHVGIQKFKEDISLTDEEIDTIVRWADNGAPQGNPADMPPARTFDEGAARFALGKPDLVIMSPETVVLPVAPDWWGDYDVDSGLTEDRYFRAVETKPSVAGQRVNHHANSSLIPPESDRDDVAGGGLLSEYAVGKNADIYPENTGRLIKAGSKIRFSMHYHSIGEEIHDKVTVALWMYPKGYVPKYTEQMLHAGDVNFAIDIPGNTDNVRTDGYFVMPKPGRATSFQPHLHINGKRQCVEAILPNGWIEMLSCAKTVFAWAGRTYTYADDVAPLLPAGTILHVISWYNNTPSNKFVPDPRNWAGYGQRSVDNMSHAWIGMVYLSDDDYKAEVAVRASRTATAQ